MGGCASKDMAIGIVLFNPTRSKRIIHNYFTMIRELKDFPVFTLELIYNGRNPEIPDAFHIYGNSIMFHKENLCRILEKRIPSKYTKLAFLDADLIFEDCWYEKASKLLDTCDVIQLFDKCQWLDIDGEVSLERYSVLNMKDPIWNPKYHPGFAWGFKREWYNRVGFFDYAVSGSGDTLSVIKWMRKLLPKKFKSLPFPLVREFAEFCPEPPKMSNLKGTVKHLWHGTRENRKYVERHQMLEVTKDIKELLEKNKDGLFEWKESKMTNIFLEYFISRNDDGIEHKETS